VLQHFEWPGAYECHDILSDYLKKHRERDFELSWGRICVKCIFDAQQLEIKNRRNENTGTFDKMPHLRFLSFLNAYHIELRCHKREKLYNIIMMAYYGKIRILFAENRCDHRNQIVRCRKRSLISGCDCLDAFHRTTMDLTETNVLRSSSLQEADSWYPYELLVVGAWLPLLHSRPRTSKSFGKESSIYLCMIINHRLRNFDCRAKGLYNQFHIPILSLKNILCMICTLDRAIIRK